MAQHGTRYFSIVHCVLMSLANQWILSRADDELAVVNPLLKHIVNVIGCDCDAGRVVVPGVNLRYLNGPHTMTSTCATDR